MLFQCRYRQLSADSSFPIIDAFIPVQLLELDSDLLREICLGHSTKVAEMPSLPT